MTDFHKRRSPWGCSRSESEGSGLPYPNSVTSLCLYITIFVCSSVIKSSGNWNFDHAVRGFWKDHSDLIRVYSSLALFFAILIEYEKSIKPQSLSLNCIWVVHVVCNYSAWFSCSITRYEGQQTILWKAKVENLVLSFHLLSGVSYWQICQWKQEGWRNLLRYWSSHHYSNYCTFYFPCLAEGKIDSDLLVSNAS